MTTPREIAIARVEMDKAMGNIPSVGDGPGGNSISDRTGNAATSHPDRDPARRDSDTLDRLLASCERRARSGKPTDHIAHAINILVQRWQPLNAKMAEGLRSQGNESGDGWCQSHWRVGSAERPRTEGSQLCRWCEDVKRELTVRCGFEVGLPPRSIVDMRARGMRITERDIDRAVNELRSARGALT